MGVLESYDNQGACYPKAPQLKLCLSLEVLSGLVEDSLIRDVAQTEAEQLIPLAEVLPASAASNRRTCAKLMSLSRVPPTIQLNFKYPTDCPR